MKYWISIGLMCACMPRTFGMEVQSAGLPASAAEAVVQTPVPPPQSGLENQPSVPAPVKIQYRLFEQPLKHARHVTQEHAAATVRNVQVDLEKINSSLEKPAVSFAAIKANIARLNDLLVRTSGELMQLSANLEEIEERLSMPVAAPVPPPVITSSSRPMQNESVTAPVQDAPHTPVLPPVEGAVVVVQHENHSVDSKPIQLHYDDEREEKKHQKHEDKKEEKDPFDEDDD